MMVTFHIPGQPVAKGRPRFARRGGFVVAYTDAKTLGYEHQVKLAASIAMRGLEPSPDPLALAVVLDMQIPDSWSKRRRALAASGSIAATKKPDADNILKGIKDGCNGIVWRDDAQVVRITLEKRYSETPGAHVEVTRASGESA